MVVHGERFAVAAVQPFRLPSGEDIVDPGIAQPLQAVFLHAVGQHGLGQTDLTGPRQRVVQAKPVQRGLVADPAFLHRLFRPLD